MLISITRDSRPENRYTRSEHQPGEFRPQEMREIRFSFVQTDAKNASASAALQRGTFRVTSESNRQKTLDYGPSRLRATRLTHAL